MSPVKTSRKWFRFFSSGISMQQRLPLFIFILLLGIVTAFSWISYIGVKKAALQSGQGRLLSLTTQLSSLFGQSAQALNTTTHTSAQQPILKNYLNNNTHEADTAVLSTLKKLRPDSSWVLTELLNKDKAIVLQSGLPGKSIPFDRNTVISSLKLNAESSRIGKLHTIKDSIYYPVVSAISDKNEITGYLIRWRLQLATARSIALFSQLLGTDARFIIGNADGSLWTDLNTAVPSPPPAMQELFHSSEYKRPNEQPMIGTAQSVPNTPWVVLVEFPKKIVMSEAKGFLTRTILIGTLLILIGSFIAWLLSRNITRPVNKLTALATAITKGDFSQRVIMYRGDEIGQLARAFNTMLSQVQNVHQTLERAVQDRTGELEKANKELEAFSYSVSHDLRAPLRIIDGYVEIVRTDYENKLDAEGQNMLNIIAANARKMGKLIDDLLDLSRLGRKELLVHPVDMNRLIEAVLTEHFREDTARLDIQVGKLETAECDNNLIRQVWINLISNAIKYSANRDKPEIKISSYKKDTHIVYCIKDNGVGFDMQYADKLFGVFQRLHKISEYEGTGVGLALVQRIVTKHGGTVWAEAEKDKGAAFYFSLPEIKDKQPIL